MLPLVLLLILLSTTDSKTGYTEFEAQSMLAMSAAAYSSTPNECIQRALPNARTWTFLSQWELVCDNKSNNCSAFIAQSNYRQEIIVAFRGTNKRSQLLVEAAENLLPDAPYRDIGMIDKYFMTAIDQMWPSILPYINGSQTMTKNYTVTG